MPDPGFDGRAAGAGAGGGADGDGAGGGGMTVTAAMGIGCQEAPCATRVGAPLVVSRDSAPPREPVE